MDLLIESPYVRWALILVSVGAIFHRARSDVNWAKVGRQVFIVMTAYFAYFLVRGMTQGSESLAVENAWRIVDLEKTLGLFHEERLQSWIADHQWLIDVANWIYIYGHWPVIGLLALWLLLRHESQFLLYRNAFLISGAIGLVIFATFPVAPPRLIDLDLVDTITKHSHSYRVLQPPALVNQYAAVPSLHFGWNLLIAIALWRNSRAIAARVFAVVLPVLMLAAVVLTANHFIIDAPLGAAVALFGLLIAANLHRISWRPSFWRRQAGKPARERSARGERAVS